MEEQLPAGPGERQVAKLVQDVQVEAGEGVGQASGLALGLLLFKLVDQVQQVEEAHSGPAADAVDADGDAQVRLAGACAADEDDVCPRLHEAALAQRPDPVFDHRRGRKVEALQVLHHGKLGDPQPISDAAHVTLGLFRPEQREQDLLWRRAGSASLLKQFVIGAVSPVQTQVLEHAQHVIAQHVHPAGGDRSDRSRQQACIRAPGARGC